MKIALRKLFFLTGLFLCCSFAASAGGGVRVIVIDPGHGGTDPGANRGKVYESHINLAVALKLGALIEKELPGIKVVYTRTTDKRVELSERTEIANKAGADLFFSIHTNAVEGSSSAQGVETLVMGEDKNHRNERALYDNNREELIDMSDERTAAIVRAYIQNLQFTYGRYSDAMARLIQTHLVKAGRVDRGVKGQPLHVLFNADMPGVLTEIGFISNDAERAWMTSEKGQDRIARALMDALKGYVEYVDLSLGVSGAEEADDEATDGAVPAATCYAVQLLSSAKSVPLKDRQFKSYRGRVKEYVAEGRYKYKYCVGEFADRAAAEEMLAEVKKEFKDAFIVQCREDGIL